jgi:hypothetical protein
VDKRTQDALARPFPTKSLGWKPQTISKNGDSALAVCFIDARDVMDRLDEVIGVQNWKDEYEFLQDGSAMCHLSVRFGDEWVTKVDVGSESDQKDSGDRHKSAISDSLKRAAVKFGVGRYIYSLPLQWCPYDSVKKVFKQTPSLPDFAIPDEEKPKARKAPEKAEPKPEAPKADAPKADPIKLDPVPFASDFKKFDAIRDAAGVSWEDVSKSVELITGSKPPKKFLEIAEAARTRIAADFLERLGPLGVSKLNLAGTKQ